MQFSSMLKKRRKELQITQQEMADKLFVTRQTVSRWENNLSYPNLDVLIEISEILNLSLDELLKGEGVDVVNKISKDVILKRKYKRISIVISIVLGICVGLILILGIGRYTQNKTIDRINPFLTTEYGYGVLPQKSKSQVDTFISDDPFGNGEWLKLKTGQYSKQNRWVLVSHRGSYVSNVRIIEFKEIPKDFKVQVGTKYFKYDKHVMGPRVSKKWNWSPFN